MTQKIKKVFNVLFFAANIICIILLLLALPAPFADPVKYWPVAIAGLLFPAFLVLVFLFGIYWLFVQKRKSLYSFVAVLLALPALYHSVGMHLFSSFKEPKQQKAIRVLSWNVGLMNYTETDTVKAIANNLVIFDKIKKADADIVCLQEFFSEIVPGNHYNIMDSIAHTL
ncbi:MAG: hypothetical protein EOP00_23300, partial [Pedobacter sp.]